MFSHIHGPDCKCGTGAAGGGAGAGAGADMAAYMRMASSAAMQSRPPRRAPAASSEPFAVAPAPAFLSPFIEPQEMATRNVLAQIHPDGTNKQQQRRGERARAATHTLRTDTLRAATRPFPLALELCCTLCSRWLACGCSLPLVAVCFQLASPACFVCAVWM